MLKPVAVDAHCCAGFLFGSVEELASRLRASSAVRILNRQGRYVCFFLKVDYLPAGMLHEVDDTSEEFAARDVRWWRADELLGSVAEEQLLERMLTPSDAATLQNGPAAAHQRLSAFHRAVYKTLSLENAHPHAHERWHSTVLSTIATGTRRGQLSVSDRQVAGTSQSQVYSAALAAAAYAPRKRGSRRGPPKAQLWKAAEEQWREKPRSQQALEIELKLPSFYSEWSGFSP